MSDRMMFNCHHQVASLEIIKNIKQEGPDKSQDLPKNEFHAKAVPMEQDTRLFSQSQSPIKPPVKRRHRTCFTPYQVSILQQEFNEQAYLTRENRQRLSELLGVEEQVITVWFQNQRQKLKTGGAAQNGDISNSYDKELYGQNGDNNFGSINAGSYKTEDSSITYKLNALQQTNSPFGLKRLYHHPYRSHNTNDTQNNKSFSIKPHEPVFPYPPQDPRTAFPFLPFPFLFSPYIHGYFQDPPSSGDNFTSTNNIMNSNIENIDSGCNSNTNNNYTLKFNDETGQVNDCRQPIIEPSPVPCLTDFIKNMYNNFSS